MLQDVKALVVVLVLTAPIWFLAKRLFSSQSKPGEFSRRRNLWLFLTTAGMLAPSIWIYLALAIPAILWTGRRESNPVALYILLCFVIPNVSVPLPSIIVNALFDVNNQRLLALTLILPALLQARKERYSQSALLTKEPLRRFDSMDVLLGAYILLTILLFIPYESVTNTLRRATLAVIDIGFLFAFWSRLTPKHEVMRDCLGTWVVAGMLMSVVAVFETGRSWLLYAPIAERWGVPNDFAFLLRAGALRAQVSTGHSLTLGIWLAISWALFLYIQSTWNKKSAKILVGLILIAGLGASMARGAWIAAIFATVVFFLLNPKGLTAAIKAISGLTFIFGLFLLSPFGERFIQLLPFVGTLESGNVEYRQRLFERSIELIWENPWFGDPFVMLQMESLRQGQGIIDLVNGYLVIALFHGLVGLCLFVGFLLLGLRQGRYAWRAFRRAGDADATLLGAALLAAMLGTILFIATAGVDPMTYMLAGLLSAYAWRVQRTQRISVGSRIGNLSPMKTSTDRRRIDTSNGVQ
jgi:hypothetical protein